MTVQASPENDVFIDDGHLTRHWQMFLGVKSTEHDIQSPPFPQTMYVNGVMTDPWTVFFQKAKDKINIEADPLGQPFITQDNKISEPWLDWFNKW
jgi:hypothetical protein